MDQDQLSILISNMADADQAVALGHFVEACGYRRAWLAETRTGDMSGIGAVLSRETSLELGTAIVPVYSRSPALLAMMAATWSRLGGGRPVHLGIGAGGQAIVERWHGVPFARPLTTTGDTIEILRQAFAGGKTDYEGTTRSSKGFSLSEGPQPDIRIHIGGMGPGMRRLAAERADGLIVTWLSPRALTILDREFREHAAGRDVRLIARAYVHVGENVEEVREAVRQELIEYVVSPPYGRYFRAIGFAAEVNAAQAAFAEGDRAGTTRAISDRLLDEMLIIGDADHVAGQLREFAAADEVMIQCVPPGRHGDPNRTIGDVAEVLGFERTYAT